MLADLFKTLGKGVAEQLTYWVHTYVPVGRWRKATNEVIAQISEQSATYGISSSVDRRRAYQVARMMVPNRHGEHLADLTPDAYNRFSPTCCAKSHSGKKKIAPPAERVTQYICHPQTLAYVLTPPGLSRLGGGASAPGTICGVPTDDATPSVSVIASNLTEGLGGKGGGIINEYAEIVAKLHTGPPKQEEEPAVA